MMITVIVPVLNEEKNITGLLEEISNAAQACPISEIIYVNDNSTDKTLDVLNALKEKYPSLRVLSHDRRCGQSAALWAGIKAAGNDLIVTLDGDGQNDPADIPLLYNLYETNKSNISKVMVAGERRKRNDSLSRRIASRFANRLRAKILNDQTKDTGCSLKLFRRKDYLALPYFNHMHRFLPALMIREGVRLMHIDVNHRERQYGISKYGNFSRAFVGISDLFGVWWLQKRPYSYPQITEDMKRGK
jgi:dolichol-phosphate mannosyltransferase